MGISKRCSNCKQLYTGKRCMSCANRLSKHRQAVNETLKAYNSAQWEKCRQNVRLRYSDYDIWLLGAGELRVSENVCVHHIKEREEAPALFYELDNLITVGRDSHAEIHVMYKTDKAAALARINKGINKFKELFGW